MFFLRQGVLSDKNIRSLLGKQIFIHPYSESNLKGATYNLTASMCAFIEEKKGEHSKTKKLIVTEDNIIIIPKNKTALIQTNESIYVSNKICGTYHSRVSLVNKGLSHIGTTLDPGYFGTSVIAIHNASDEDEEIKVGEPIVSIMFYKLISKSQNSHDNFPFRKDLFDLEITEFYNEEKHHKSETCDTTDSCECKLRDKDIKNKARILEELEKWKKAEFRSNRSELVKEVKRYVEQRDLDRNINRINYVIAGIVCLITIVLLGIIWTNDTLQISDKMTTSGTLLVIPLALFLLPVLKEIMRGRRL